MAGYYAIKAQQPDIVGAAGNIANLIMRNRALRQNESVSQQNMALRREQVQRDVMLEERRQQQAAEQLRMRQEQAELQRVANVRRFVSGALKSQRIDEDQARSILDRYGANMEPVGMSEAVGQPTLDPAQLEAGAAAELGVQPEPRRQTLKPTGDLVDFMTATGMKPGAPGFAEEYRKWRLEGKRAASPKTQLTVGLTKGERTSVGKDVMRETGILANLEAVRQKAKPEQFGYLARARNKGASFIAQLNPKWLPKTEEEFLRNRTKVYGAVEMLFQQYRKYVTGAQAGLVELERLKGTFLNPDQSWPEFQARMEELQDRFARGIRLKRKILRENKHMSPEEIGDLVDQEIVFGDEQANSKKDRNARLDELGGMSEADKLLTLHREGYIDQQTLDAALGKLGE